MVIAKYGGNRFLVPVHNSLEVKAIRVNMIKYMRKSRLMMNVNNVGKI